MANDFCLYCVGGHRNIIDIYQCEDRNCPFYLDRRANLDWQEQKKGWKIYHQKSKKLTKSERKKLIKLMESAVKALDFLPPKQK